MNAQIKAPTGADALNVTLSTVKGCKSPSINTNSKTWAEVASSSLWQHKEREDRDGKERKDGKGFVFASFTTLYREAQNVDKYYGVVLDVDAVDVSALPPQPEEAVARLEALGLAAIVCTSHNHMTPPELNKGKPQGARYRVIVPLSEPIEPSQLKAATEHLASLVNLTIDKHSYSAAQFFYFPSCRPKALRYSAVVAGNALDVTGIPIIEQTPQVAPRANITQSVSSNPQWTETKLAANGRWVEILAKLDIHPPSFDPAAHTACPACGGDDRFRFDDKDGDGTFICSQGGAGNLAGDGFRLIQHVRNCEPSESLRLVREALGLPVEDLEADLKRLASLSLIDYERCRAEEAKRLNVRTSVLDKLIKPYQVDEEEEGREPSLFPNIEPWDDEVDGVALMDEIASIIERHIVCEKNTTHAATLWIAFSWCIDVMQVSPIACITAPEKRCGKTQLLNLIGMLCMKPLPASNITAAALFRSIEAFKPTLLIDEADSFLKDKEELRGIINSGHTKASAFVIRTVGDNHEAKRFSTWGAKAISGIGQLSDTLKDRSILLELRRKQPHEKRDKLRHTDSSQFETNRRKLARWAADNMEALRVARPELPEALNDRAQDNWESLLAIADRVGGHWGKTARHAAMAISGIEDEAPSINEELLADIKQIFEKSDVTRISSMDMLLQLCSDDEAPWATWTHGKPMTPRQLSKRLSEFGIASKPLRDMSGVFKGYELSDFKDAFNRYLKVTPTHTPIESVTRLQPNGSKAFSQNLSVTDSDVVTDRKQLEPLQTKACNRVTDRKGLRRERRAYTTKMGELVCDLV